MAEIADLERSGTSGHGRSSTMLIGADRTVIIVVAPCKDDTYALSLIGIPKLIRDMQIYPIPQEQQKS